MPNSFIVLRTVGIFRPSQFEAYPLSVYVKILRVRLRLKKPVPYAVPAHYAVTPMVKH